MMSIIKQGDKMSQCFLVAGLDGTGKSSLRFEIIKMNT